MSGGQSTGLLAIGIAFGVMVTLIVQDALRAYHESRRLTHQERRRRPRPTLAGDLVSRLPTDREERS